MVRLESHPDDPNLIFSPEWIGSLANQMPPGISIPVDLAGLIQSIHVSPLAKPWFVDLVEIVAERHGFAKLVQKSRLLGEPVY